MHVGVVLCTIRYFVTLKNYSQTLGRYVKLNSPNCIKIGVDYGPKTFPCGTPVEAKRFNSTKNERKTFSREGTE